MKSSPGSASVSAFSTVSPPIPESNTPIGRSAADADALDLTRPLDAEIFVALALFLFFVILYWTADCQSFADFSWSRWSRAKDSFMDTRGLHAQICGNVGAGFSKSLRERPIKFQPERSEGAKAPIAREHVLTAQHRIGR